MDVRLTDVTVPMTLLHRLMLLVLLAMLPVGGMEIYNQMQLRETRKSEIRQQALNMAMLIDAQQEQLIEGVRQILLILRHSPAIRGGDFAACQEALGRVKEGLPPYLDVHATDPDGVIRCTTDQSALGVKIADRPHVREALQKGDFVVGEHVLLRTNQQSALPFAMSYTWLDGRPAGIVSITLSLAWLHDYLLAHPLPDGAIAVIADPGGTVLTWVPGPPDLAGTRLPDHFDDMLHAAAPGVTETTGIHGVQRLFGFVPVRPGAKKLFVAVGFDEKALVTSINAAATRHGLMLAVTLAAGLAMLWWTVRRDVAIPATALVAATRRWQEGDMTARARIGRGSPEMVGLGKAFDAMADSLEAEATSRKGAENDLRLSEGRYRSIVNTAADAFVVIDQAGIIQSFNPAAERMFGFASSEAVGQNVTMLMPEPDRSRHDGYIANHIRTGERKVIGIGREVVGRRKDGSTFPLDLSIAEWEVAGVRQFAGVMRDFSRRKEVEASLRRAKEDAERANLAKSKFLAAASHDLRQPLQSAFLFMELARAQVDGGKGAEPLARVQQGLDVLKGLLDGLLDISRLDAGIVHPVMRTVRLSEVLADIAGYSAVIAAKGLHWRVGDCTASIQTDPVLFGQILRNLIDNAIKFTAEGEVRVECRTFEDHVWVEVHDSGIGIPPDQMGLIFEEFYQVGNPERDREKGLGLGLAIVRRLSSLLDHPVEVRSTPGRGSVFRVGVRRGAEASEASDNASVVSEGGTAAHAGWFAVLVDDEPMVLVGLEAMLRSWGYDILAAASAEAAIEGLRQDGRRPDIIVSDYRLREGKVGTDAVQAIKAAVGADIPAFIITGETRGLALRDATKHGLSVLQKPVPPGVLRQELERQLASAQGLGA